jgi:hypothetical protein
VGVAPIRHGKEERSVVLGGVVLLQSLFFEEDEKVEI